MRQIFKVLGTVDIRSQIDTGYKLGLNVIMSRFLKIEKFKKKMLNCVKFCGHFELPLRGHNEKISSKNQGVFCRKIDLLQI